MAIRPATKVAVIALVALALTLAFAGTAAAHTQNTDAVSCSTVTGTFEQFSAGNHPIVWNVAINGGAYQAVATTETPSGFVGSGTASADISSLTKVFDGSGGTVSTYAQWPGGQSTPATTHLDSCGTPPTTPPTTPTPPTTGGPTPRPPIVVVVSPAPIAFAPAPATPVAASPRTTG